MKKFKMPKFKLAKVNAKATGAPTSDRADAYGKEAEKRINAFKRQVKKS